MEGAIPQRLFLTSSRPATPPSSATAFRRNAVPEPSPFVMTLFQSMVPRPKSALP